MKFEGGAGKGLFDPEFAAGGAIAFSAGFDAGEIYEFISFKLSIALAPRELGNGMEVPQEYLK